MKNQGNTVKLRKTYIEITNACNLSCSFCGGTSRAPQFMEPGLFARLLEQIRGISRHLYFHVMGEPLLHPQLGRFLDLCEPYGYKVHLITNGRLLSTAAPGLLNKPALSQVGISLHSLEPTLSDGDIESFLETVRTFASRAADQGGLWVMLRLWNGGVEDPSPAGMNKRILRSLERVLALPSPPAGTPGQISVVRLAPHLSLQFAPRFDWPDPSTPLLGRAGTCYGLRDQCAVLADGTVVPCCLDRNAVMDLGSAARSPLRDILEGERAERIRSGFRRRIVVEDLCRRCTYRRRFDRREDAEVPAISIGLTEGS
jgi:organic radical activating enzyme